VRGLHRIASMAASRQFALAALVIVVAALFVSTGFFGDEAAAQRAGTENPPLIIKSMVGRDLYEFYCATCHGHDGKGGGPVVQALRVPPPDLTTIAARNHGEFPEPHVEALVTGGRDMPAAHGSRDMPVWGPIFRGLDTNDRLNRIRIRNIVDYLASMQTR
jgi:mono/diheme cytochrome c family protein